MRLFMLCVLFVSQLTLAFPATTEAAVVVQIVTPAANAEITERAATAFVATAHDPASGAENGAGIASVEFQLTLGDQVIYTKQERSPAYCMFGNNGPCDPMAAERWNNLAPATYTIRVRATTSGGRQSAWLEQPVHLVPRLGSKPYPERQTMRLKELPESAPEIVNPLRGLYRWKDQAYAPQPRPALDSYERYAWRDLEPRPGQYDFSVIERDLAAAQQAGRKHALRIRAMINGKGPTVPDYLVNRMGRGWWSDGTYVPDWNDADFLDRMAQLIAELGRRYNNDPRIGWVDIGFYGNWGEWHTWPLDYPARNGATDMREDDKQRIVDLMAAAFPDTQLIMGSEDEATLVYALRRYPQMGWRRDSLGSWIFDENSTFRNLKRLPADWELVMDRWKTAPIITEFISPNDQDDPAVYRLAQEQAHTYHVSMISNGNTLEWDSLSTAGRDALLTLGKRAGYRLALTEITLPSQLASGAELWLTSAWVNRGNAPVYEDWQPTLELRDRQGQARWRALLNIDLRTLLPDDNATQFEDRFTLPSDLLHGTYDLVLNIRDPQSYRASLALAVDGVREDGSYRLGEVTIVGSEGEASFAQEYRVHLPILKMS